MFDELIDIHCHLLPNMDDGSRNMEMSLSMARLAEKDITHTIIATPHFWYGYYENDFEAVALKVKELSEMLKAEKVNLTILPGQEVFFDGHTLDFYKKGIIKGLNSSRYLLMELPMDRMPDGVFEGIYELHLMGAEVIIAHPERYRYVIEKPSVINDFIKEGCLFQLNRGSITGALGGSIKKTAATLLQHNICHFIASDAHSDGRRSPGLLEVFDHINKDLKPRLYANGEALIENREIKDYSEKIENRSFFSFMRKK